MPLASSSGRRTHRLFWLAVVFAWIALASATRRILSISVFDEPQIRANHRTRNYLTNQVRALALRAALLSVP